ncbi:hypothetical protein V6D72_002958 [Salmonella enterica]|nr:hypothetical protein [Salmonella enterica]
MKAYCTENNILVTQDTLNRFKKIIFDVPFYCSGDQRAKVSYYLSIAIFLQHLICSATVSRHTKKRAKFKGDDEWSYSVPFPSELGRKVAPAVFMKQYELPFKRALEQLEIAGIIKIFKEDFCSHKCREFSLSRDFLECLFTGNRQNYLERNDRYMYLTDIYGKRQYMCRLDELMVGATKRTCKVKHKTSIKKVPDKQYRDFVIQVYSNLEPLNINIDALIGFCNKNPTSKYLRYYYNFISHLCNVGVELVSYEPLVVAYRQSYKTAKLGGRSFEDGTGFQYLPQEMKWSCLAFGYNYDIKSCQLEILRHELKQIGLSDNNLKCLDSCYICKKLGITEEYAKGIRFATIFNGGGVSLSPKTAVFKQLKRIIGEYRAKKVLKRWKKLMAPLSKDLEFLVDHYMSLGKKNRYGLCVRNAVGQNFNCTYKAPGKRRQPQQMRRKLLAHMIQGIESKAVYDFVATYKGVCALEHDGFVSLRELNVRKDWNHPYLKLVRKN